MTEEGVVRIMVAPRCTRKLSLRLAAPTGPVENRRSVSVDGTSRSCAGFPCATRPRKQLPILPHIVPF